MRFSPARRAFTLVEILVVLGVLVLLSALAFPIFGRVRESGRRTTCTNNLNQLGIAFQQYAQDHSQKFPFPGNYQYWASGAHWVTGGTNGVPKDFKDAEKGLADAATYAYVEGHEAYPEQGALWPYVKQASTYVCPSAKSASEKRLSYSMNCAVGAARQAQLINPAEIVLLMDEGDTLNDGFFWASKDPNSTDALLGVPETPEGQPRGHNGGGNILFSEGHVKFYLYKDFPVDKSVAGRDLKTRLVGTPRFLDKNLRPKGANPDPAHPDRDFCFNPIP